jgi:ribonuclease HI
MAVGMIWDRSLDKPIMIGMDSQAAMKALQHCQPTGGCFIADSIHSRIKLVQCQNARLRVTIHWIPAHHKVRRNELVDRGTKEAARGLTSERTFLHKSIEDLPFSLAAAQ